MKKLTKYLICIVIFLLLGIISKQNIEYKEKIHQKLYEETISFTSFENLYNKYLGGIFPIENINNQINTEQVFDEKLNYTNIEKYEEGIKLLVNNNYLVPNQEKGIVVFIGEKEKYGNVVIIETETNINIWYGNICNPNVKIYDHLNKSDIIGETCTEDLYIVYKKGNQILDYNEHLN